MKVKGTIKKLENKLTGGPSWGQTFKMAESTGISSRRIHLIVFEQGYKQKFRNLTKPRASRGVCVVQLQLQRIYHPRVAPRATAALQRPSHEDNLYFLHPVPNS